MVDSSDDLRDRYQILEIHEIFLVSPVEVMLGLIS
jgi:hypothetical protein